MPSGRSETELSLALESYRILMQMLQHEEGLFWRINEIFVLINGGMIAILGFIHPTDPSQSMSSLRAFYLLFCLIGLIMCFLWLVAIKRSKAFYEHWYEQLIYLERRALKPFKVFQLADQYFDEGRIKLGNKELKLDKFTKRFRIYHSLIGAPAVFLVAWLVLAIYLFW